MAGAITIPSHEKKKWPPWLLTVTKMGTGSRDWTLIEHWPSRDHTEDAVIELWPPHDWAVTSPSRDWAVINGPWAVTIFFLMGLDQV